MARDAHLPQGTCTWPGGCAQGLRDVHTGLGTHRCPGTRTRARGRAHGSGDGHMARGWRARPSQGLYPQLCIRRSPIALPEPSPGRNSAWPSQNRPEKGVPAAGGGCIYLKLPDRWCLGGPWSLPDRRHPWGALTASNRLFPWRWRIASPIMPRANFAVGGGGGLHTRPWTRWTFLVGRVGGVSCTLPFVFVSRYICKFNSNHLCRCHAKVPAHKCTCGRMQNN